MNNQILFDISQQPYAWPPIILGLCFTLIGLAGLLSPRFRRVFRIPPTVVAIVGVSVTLGLLALQWSNQQRYQSMLANGQYVIAEGQVEQVQAAPERIFVVSGIAFAEPNLALPLQPGQHVRVFYTPSVDPAEHAAVLRIEGE